MGKKQSDSDAPEKPGFEQSLGELEEIVRRLEEGDIGLGESLAHYERGVRLLRRCYELLEKAERRIELLTGVDAEGNPLCTPLEDASLSLDEKVHSRSRRRSAAPAEDLTPDEGPGEVDDGRESGQNDVDPPGRLF